MVKPDGSASITLYKQFDSISKRYFIWKKINYAYVYLLSWCESSFIESYLFLKLTIVLLRTKYLTLLTHRLDHLDHRAIL